MFSGPGCGDYPHHLNGFSGAGSGEFVFGDTPVAAPSSSGHPRPSSDYHSSSGGGAATPPTSVMLGSGPAWYHHHHEDRDEVGANQQFESEHFFHEMGFEIAVFMNLSSKMVVSLKLEILTSHRSHPNIYGTV